MKMPEWKRQIQINCEKDRKRCEKCNEPTKFICALACGVQSQEHYDCQNLNCDIKQKAVKSAIQSEENEKRNKETNKSNGIDIETFDELRRAGGLTLMRLSKSLSISLPELCDYLYLRKAVPKEKVGVFNFMSTALTEVSDE